MIAQIMSHADLKIFMHASLVFFVVFYVFAVGIVLNPRRKKHYQEISKKVIQDEQD
jgi:hypothetical protein